MYGLISPKIIFNKENTEISLWGKVDNPYKRLTFWEKFLLITLIIIVICAIIALIYFYAWKKGDSQIEGVDFSREQLIN